ncbi:uncharacterized protein LOC128677361 [Plodia interpunctella]|uniref:uncharacterized protein LOC128677361 n=1 Tax=Plodia interpunctella TaxID=58824 RepID=UPI0023680358|nr:uncharacterized protein LOC128677361 [Plodia interpunctella]
MCTVSVFFLILSCQVFGVRRQLNPFDHYKEFLAKQEEEKAALRQSGYNKSQLKTYFSKAGKRIGPKRTLEYNPRWGYEPYWKGGDWVFNRSSISLANGTCGHKCSDIYKQYGTVCAVTNRIDYSKWTSHYYKTFENICAVRSYDCYDRGLWRVIYRGKCREGFTTYPYPTPSVGNTAPKRTALLHIDVYTRVALNAYGLTNGGFVARRVRGARAPPLSGGRVTKPDITHLHKIFH